MAYISFQPSDFFGTVLYTGNSTADRQITQGFQPDMAWARSRTNTEDPAIFDSVRGEYRLMANNANAQDSNSGVTAWNSTGYVVGSTDSFNSNSQSFINWAWKAGTTTGIDTTGSTITPSGYSFNATCGFSVVKYSGNDTSGATVPHGLGVAPAMVIVKSLVDHNWVVQHQSLGPTKHIYLDTTAGSASATNRWNDTAPTAVNVVLGNTASTNGSGGGDSPFIMYSFAEKKGFSKFSSFVGNGNNNGTMVYTGFRPAYILVKKDAASDWFIWDDKRSTTGKNVCDDTIMSNNNSVETSVNIDINANGFKLRDTNVDANDAGSKFIYAAFAEFPVVSSNSKAGVAR